MSPQRWTRIALGFLILISVQVGLWALFAPQAFYDDFPGLGRAWINVDGPYNEHLIRDVGALNLALGALFVTAWVRLDRSLVIVAGAAALTWGVPHAIYHIANTEVLSGSDVVLNVGTLMLYVVVGGGLVWSARHFDESGVTRDSLGVSA